MRECDLLSIQPIRNTSRMRIRNTSTEYNRYMYIALACAHRLTFGTEAFVFRRSSNVASQLSSTACSDTSQVAEKSLRLGFLRDALPVHGAQSHCKKYSIV